MIKIILCCQNGASTDILATAMEKAGNDMKIEMSINAYPYSKLENVIEGADLVLVAPQIRYKLKTFEKTYAHLGIPFYCIETTDYGLVKGKEVLEKSLALLNK